MLAAIYLRISQDRTGEELGVDRQREACLAHVERRGWEVLDIFVDNDVSATKAKPRPEWERMMAEVEAGRVQVVVGWAIDRTLRSGRDRLRMLESGKQHGIIISLVRGSDMDLSTPSGRTAADVLGAFALGEIEMKSDRQKAAHQQAAQQGRRIGGRKPFGYLPDGVTPHPVEADAVKKAFNDYLAGTPLSVIAQQWNDAGLLSGVVRKDGTSRWEHTGVRHLLKNPRYMGMRRHKPKDGPEEIYPASWPALVDEKTWRAVQAQLDAVAGTFKPKAGRQLLTGIIRCAVCDELLVGGGKLKAARVGEPMYRCPSGKHVCRIGTPIEGLILELMAARLSRGDVRAAVAEPEPEQRDLNAERDELVREMETIALERAQRKITPAQFRTLNEQLMADLEALEADLARAGQTDVVGELLAGPDPGGRFLELDRDRQRMVIGSLMEIRLESAGKGAKVFRPETVRVAWK